MNILVFSKIPIAPAYGGNRQRIRTLLNELRHDHAVTFALIPSRQARDIDLNEHEDFFGAGKFVAIKRGLLAGLIFNAGIVRRKVHGRIFGKMLSDDVDYLFDRSLKGACKHLIETVKPDVIIIEYIHFSKILEWVPNGVYKVIDTHDSFSHEFTSEAERKGLERADMVLAIQDREASMFKDLLGAASRTQVTTVSHIVAGHATIDSNRCEGASFVGSNFEANNQSLASLIANVMPMVLAERPNFKLHVIGDVGTAIPDYPFVVKHGRVKVVAHALARAPVLANYIVKGTGIKIKMLDAMGMGLACVSTALGADGLSDAFADGVCVTDDDRQFADELIALFDNAARRAALGRAGLEAVARWNTLQRSSLQSAINPAS